jgi:hypothetical protein
MLETVRNIDLDTTMYAAFIGAAVSFIVWAITVGSDRLFHYIQRRSEHRSNLTFLSFLLMGAITYANRQNRILRDYISQFDSFKIDYEPLSVTPNPDAGTISERIDQEKYFAAYIKVFSKKRDSIHAFKNFFTTNNYLKIQLDRLIAMSNSFYEDEVKNLKAFSDAMQQGLYKVGQAFHDPANDDLTKEFILFASNQFQIYSAKRTSRGDFGAAMTLYVEPMMQAFMNKYHKSNTAIEISIYINEAKSIFEVITLNRKNYRNELAFLYNNLIAASKSLQEDSIPLIKKYIPDQTISNNDTA